MANGMRDNEGTCIVGKNISMHFMTNLTACATCVHACV